MTPPGSDAREAVTHTPSCATRRGKWCDCEAGDAVLLRRSFAQRILAALESLPLGKMPYVSGLRDELRAVIGK